MQIAQTNNLQKSHGRTDATRTSLVLLNEENLRGSSRVDRRVALYTERILFLRYHGQDYINKHCKCHRLLTD